MVRMAANWLSTQAKPRLKNRVMNLRGEDADILTPRRKRRRRMGFFMLGEEEKKRNVKKTEKK